MDSGEVSVIIMAAGEGTRMKSKIPKVLHRVCGRCIIDYVLDAGLQISGEQPVVVIGHGADEIRQHLGDRVHYAVQEIRLGTGHAVMMAEPYIKDRGGYVVVLAGDTPLITGQTLSNMVSFCVEGGYDAVALSAIMDDPGGYGRILREDDGSFKAIVEHEDASPEQLTVNEINASMYCFRIRSLLYGLGELTNDNAQGEYYLTDVMHILKTRGYRCGVSIMEDSSEMMGVNTRAQLAEAERLMRQRINQKHMFSGVTLIDPDSTYIGSEVTVGRDTVIYPGNHLEGRTVIGEDCILYPGNRIVDSTIDDGARLQSSIILQSHIGRETTVGPYAYLRPNSNIGSNVRIGDFVEVKNSNIGDGSKVSHLTYIGDADLGENIIVGCGMVCVNYDGKQKHRTKIGNNAFIGCNVNLVAPVEVGDKAYIAAGSTITENVPSKSLAIARCRQTIKEGWVERKKPEVET